MSFLPPHRAILVSALALALATLVAACGQKGPLYLPDTPAAAQRATLPQTVFGGSGKAAPAPSASAPLPPALPNLPDIQ